MFARATSATKTMECWFCPACGTRLYHMPGGAAYPNRNVKPGTLDDATWLVPAIHFWTRSAQRWVTIAEDAVRYETQPEPPELDLVAAGCGATQTSGRTHMGPSPSSRIYNFIANFPSGYGSEA